MLKPMTNLAATRYEGDYLEVPLEDRLGKSLRLSGMSVQEMAAYLEVNRNTVGNWLAGRARPNPATLQMWAARCDVPYLWLRDGDDGKPAKDPRSRSKK